MQTGIFFMALVVLFLPNSICEASHIIPLARVGEKYRLQIPCRGGIPPYTFYAKKLPKGLKLETKKGIIYGKFTKGGQYSFIIGVKDREGKVIEEKVLLKVIEKKKLRENFLDWLRWLGFMVIYIVCSEFSAFLSSRQRIKNNQILVRDDAKMVYDPASEKWSIEGGKEETVADINKCISHYSSLRRATWWMGMAITTLFAWLILGLSPMGMGILIIAMIVLYRVALVRRFIA